MGPGKMMDERTLWLEFIKEVPGVGFEAWKKGRGYAYWLKTKVKPKVNFI